MIIIRLKGMTIYPKTMRIELLGGMIITLVGHTYSGRVVDITGRDKREVADPEDSLSYQSYSDCGIPERPHNPSLRAIIPPDYDRYQLPQNQDGGPLPIFISAKVRDIQKIAEQDMEVTIEWYLRLYWKDSNLSAPSHLPDGQWLNIAPDITDYVWLPTTYIDHVKEVTKPTLLVQPVSFRMQNNGMIRYSMSVTTRISCPMDFTAYPFDSQFCYFSMESYQFNIAQVTYKWHHRNVERSKNIRLGQFDFDFFPIRQENISHSTGSFPNVKIEIVLKRRISYHLLNTFLPSGLFVCVSWLTFLVPADQIPGRMVLTITTLLTLVSMFAAVREESPKVSYAKAVDQWMIMCIIFVFFVLLEFTVVIKLYELGKRAASKSSVAPDSASKNTNTTTLGSSQRSGELPISTPESSPGSRATQMKQRVWERSTSARTRHVEGGGKEDGNCCASALSLVTSANSITPIFVKSSQEKPGSGTGGSGIRGWGEWGNRVENWSLWFFPLLFMVSNLCYWVYWIGRRGVKRESQL